MTVGRQLLALGALLLLFGAVDFSRRIHVGRDPTLRAVVPVAPGALPQLLGIDAVRVQMQAWLGHGEIGSEAGGGGDQATVPSLQGVFSGRNGASAVLVSASRQGVPGRQLRVVEGDLVEGWRVVRIEQRGVTLERDGGVQHLLLFKRDDLAGAHGAPPME